MPYSVKHLPDIDTLEVTLTGLITGTDLREATTECAAIQKQIGVTRFLVYANGWEVVASFVDLYEVVEKQYIKEKLDRHSRIAVVLPTSLSAQAATEFYKTVCLNRGWNAQVHPNRQSALEWLTGTTDANSSDADEVVPRQHKLDR